MILNNYECIIYYCIKDISDPSKDYFKVLTSNGEIVLKIRNINNLYNVLKKRGFKKIIKHKKPKIMFDNED